MKTAIKVVAGIAAFLVFCLIILALMFKFSDPNRIKPILIERFKEQTGAELRIRGDIDISILPTPHLVAEDVYVNVPLKSSSMVEISAQQLDINYDLFSYFTENIKIKGFEANTVAIAFRSKQTPTKNYNLKHIEGSVTRSCCGFDFPRFSINIADGEIYGRLNIQTDLEKPLVTGAITVDGINTSKIGNQDASTKNNSKLLPDFQLPFNMFNGTDFDVELNIKETLIGSTLVQSARTKVQSKDSKTQFYPLVAKLHGGQLEGHIDLDGRNANKPLVSAKLQAKQWHLQSLLGNDIKLKGGTFNASFEGNSYGTSFSDVLGRLNGNALWVLDKSSIEHQSIKTSISDVFTGFLNFLNPANKNETHTDIYCAAIRAEIKQGKAISLNNVAVETNRFEILGSGHVNLKSEKMDYQFSLRKKKGISLPFGDFEKYIRLKGTLKEPEISFDPKGFLEEGASIFSFIVSGGLSLVAEKVFDTLKSNETPCEKVIEGR